MSLAERLKSIQERIRKASERSRFGVKPVTLLGASKAQSLNSIREAAELGVLDMGENYAQELLTKAPLCLDTDLRWHFIGKLQSNKIKHLLPYVASIHSVDSLELAERIGRLKDQIETKRPAIPILLQVNLGNERQKAGLSPNVIENLFEDFQKKEGILVVGLMTMPPQVKDVERTRGFFREMKSLFDRLKQKHLKPDAFQVLSMGMSQDFEIAIEEGATCVRIGEALFGPRPKKKEED